MEFQSNSQEAFARELITRESCQKLFGIGHSLLQDLRQRADRISAQVWDQMNLRKIDRLSTRQLNLLASAAEEPSRYVSADGTSKAFVHLHEIHDANDVLAQIEKAIRGKRRRKGRHIPTRRRNATPA